MSRFISLRVGMVAVLLLVAGCGDGSGLVRVRGVVKLDGEPLAGATVVFVTQQPGGRDAYGATDANGAFELTTLNPRDGAAPGKYKVVIQPPVEGGSATPFDDPEKPGVPATPKAPRGPRIPQKY